VQGPQLIHNSHHAEPSPNRPSLRSFHVARGLRKIAPRQRRHRRCRDIHFPRRHGAVDRRHHGERERRCLWNICSRRFDQRRSRRRRWIVLKCRLRWSTCVRWHRLRFTAGYLQEGHPRGGRLLPHLHGHGVQPVRGRGLRSWNTQGNTARGLLPKLRARPSRSVPYGSAGLFCAPHANGG